MNDRTGMGVDDKVMRALRHSKLIKTARRLADECDTGTIPDDLEAQELAYILRKLCLHIEELL